MYTIWLLSAFKPNVPISIQAWLLLKHTGHTLGVSLSTAVPKCLIGYHQYLQLLTSHGLDPCEALNLGSVCSRQLHGNMGPCSFHPILPGPKIKVTCIRNIFVLIKWLKPVADLDFWWSFPSK